MLEGSGVEGKPVFGVARFDDEMGLEMCDLDRMKQEIANAGQTMAQGGGPSGQSTRDENSVRRRHRRQSTLFRYNNRVWTYDGCSLTGVAVVASDPRRAEG